MGNLCVLFEAGKNEVEAIKADYTDLEALESSGLLSLEIDEVHLEIFEILTIISEAKGDVPVEAAMYGAEEMGDDDLPVGYLSKGWVRKLADALSGLSREELLEAYRATEKEVPYPEDEFAGDIEAIKEFYRDVAKKGNAVFSVLL